MENTQQEAYIRCMEQLKGLIADWERFRPEEELVVMVLPKYDRRERKNRLKRIYEMLLKEKWE